MTRPVTPEEGAIWTAATRLNLLPIETVIRESDDVLTRNVARALGTARRVIAELILEDLDRLRLELEADAHR